jgi:hypothetical protein
MIAILIGAFLIVFSLLSKGQFYRTHGPGLAKYGPPVEPRWIPRLMLALIGLAAILDGVWEISRH